MHLCASTQLVSGWPRIKAPLEYSRGNDKVWIYGALRIRDGKEMTRCAAARNSKNYIESLKDIEADNPTGDIFIITDDLSSHNSLETRTWLADHPRIHHVFIPKGACWLNLQKVGGASSAADEIERAGRLPQPNSTTERSLGSGDGLPRRDAICVASFLIAFEEQSSRSARYFYDPGGTLLK